MPRVVKWCDGGFEIPLGLLANAFGLTIPPGGLQLIMVSFERIGSFVLLVFLSWWEGLCGLVVAGLRFNVASLEDTLGVEGHEVVIAIGGAHVVDSLCSDFHS